MAHLEYMSPPAITRPSAAGCEPLPFTAMNIVVLVAGGLTETLQAAPLLRSLRAGAPSAHITVATPSRAGDVATRLPVADAVVALRALDHLPTPGSWLRAWVQLRRRRVDVVVVCSPRRRDAALAYAIGAPRRVGVSRLTTGFFFSDHLPRSGGNNAAVWVELAATLGIHGPQPTADFTPRAGALARVETLLADAHVDTERILVALAPGVSNADAAGVAPRDLTWAPERYAHLANQLALRHGAAIVLIGPESDRAAVNATLVDLGAPHLDLCGELDIDETAALLTRCDLLVCSDSPLLHLAAAVGTAAVGVFGPTDGRRRGPYGPAHRVVQAMPELTGRRHPGRVDSIRVEDVLAGIEAAL